MAQSGPDPQKTDAKAARATRRAAAEAEKRRAAEELHGHLARKLEAAESAIRRLEEELRMLRKTATTCAVLSSHLGGFYEEIDKLTKGKALIPVTDLIVERINEIVRDAKAIVVGDAYLDRVKEFIPAGDNPVYPDVLMTSRVVQESLERFKKNLEPREKRTSKMLRDANTIQVAVKHYLDNEEVLSKEQVQAMLGGKFISDGWFSLDDEAGIEYFDFERLDECELEKHFSDDDGQEGR